MRLNLSIFLTCLLFLSPTISFGYGASGHSIVAELAQRRLNEKATAAVSGLLGKNVSLASIASWADDYKFEASGQKTQRWHFLNLDINGNGSYGNGCEDIASKGDCIPEALKRETRVLADASQSRVTRVAALKFVVHLVGDLHQPLHCSERNDDAGGNSLSVVFIGKGPDGKSQNKPVSFHELWDETLIDAHTFSWGAYADELDITVAPKVDVVRLVDWYGWTEECFNVGKQVYALLPPSADATVKIDEAYQTKVQPILDLELTRAGIRLAAVLNEAFGQ